MIFGGFLYRGRLEIGHAEDKIFHLYFNSDNGLGEDANAVEHGAEDLGENDEGWRNTRRYTAYKRHGKYCVLYKATSIESAKRLCIEKKRNVLDTRMQMRYFFF